MNEQRPGIEWTHPWGRRGYTLNPIRGCTHACQWRMPDGQIAECYAKTIAEKRMGVAHYPHGFEEVTFAPEVMDGLSKLKDASGIFIDSMSDLFGVGTKIEWTEHVLAVIAKYPQHVFFSLTKNPPRLLRHKMPRNLWCGISAPPTFMFGKELTEDQQRQWFNRGLTALAVSTAYVKWVSMEPLSLDVSDILHDNIKTIDWAVIGAASNGVKKHQPEPTIFSKTLRALYPKPVFFKGNIDRNLAQVVAGRWLDNYPDPETV